MKYKVVTTCHGFQGRKWIEGQIVDLADNIKPPKHFVPLEQVKEPGPAVGRDPMRPIEMEPGKTLKVQGGMATGLQQNILPRILTTDIVPNVTEREKKELEKRKPGRPRKKI